MRQFENTDEKVSDEKVLYYYNNLLGPQAVAGSTQMLVLIGVNTMIAKSYRFCKLANSFASVFACTRMCMCVLTSVFTSVCTSVCMLIPTRLQKYKKLLSPTSNEAASAAWPLVSVNLKLNTKR